MKKSIVERLHEYGVVAAQLEDQEVEFSLGLPRRVTLSLPIFKSKTRIAKGDKIAIVNMEKETAIICEVSKVESVGMSKKPLLHLKGGRKVKLT